MNKRRLAGIARWLERGAPHKHNVVAFDMSEGFKYKERKATAVETNACGTICCIAGAAVQFYNKPVELIEKAMQETTSSHIPWFMVRNEAEKLLGLDSVTANKLFMARLASGGSCRHIADSKWAARVIRKLIATGEVDWEGCRTTLLRVEEENEK